MKLGEVNLKENIQGIRTEPRLYMVGDVMKANGTKINSIKPYFATDGNPILYLLCDKDDNVILGIQCSGVREIYFK